MAERIVRIMTRGIKYHGVGKGYAVPVLPREKKSDCQIWWYPGDDMQKGKNKTHPPQTHNALIPWACATCSLTVNGDTKTVF